MSLEDPFVQVKQRTLLALARDPSIPLWMRVAYVGWGSTCRNGHAALDPGELARLTATLHRTKRKVLPPAAPQLSDAIKEAVRRGVLASGSRAGCLRMPYPEITGGVCGSITSTCQSCKAKAQARQRTAARKGWVEPPFQVVVIRPDVRIPAYVEADRLGHSCLVLAA